MYIGLQIEMNHLNSDPIIADIVGLHDNGILISVPREQLENVEQGAELNIKYVEEDVNHPKTFISQVKKKIRATNLILVSYPENIQKLERRNFYRVTPWTEMEIHYSISDLERDPQWMKFKSRNLGPILPSNYKKAKLIDISGGGMAIATPVPMSNGTNIGLFLQLKNEFFKLNGRVVGCKGDEKPYKLAIEFTDIKTFERDHIMRYVFEQASGFVREKQAQLLKRQKEASIQVQQEFADNQRDALRLSDLAVPIEFKIVKDYVDAVQINYQSGLLRNVSITGASFLSRFEVPLGSNIWLKIPVENGDYIRVLGTSLRSRPVEDLDDYEIGVKFKALDAEMKKKLNTFIFDGQLRDALYPMPEPIPTQPE